MVELEEGIKPLIKATAAPTTYSATDSAFAPVAGTTRKYFSKSKQVDLYILQSHT
jgi:hypothetical protein